MTELELLLDNIEALRSHVAATQEPEDDFERALTAASSWAKLRFRPVRETPANGAVGDYFGWSLNMRGERKNRVILTFEDGKWYHWAEELGDEDADYVWLDGSPPPVPEATDEG